MDEEINKYNEAELIFGGVFYLGVDGICLVLEIISLGIGAVITPIIQSFGTFSQTMWAMAKGDKNSLKLGRQLGKYAANLMPLLPTLTTVFFIETFIHNHPKIAQLAGQVAGSVAGAAVAGPAGAKIGSAVGQYAAGGSLTESAQGAVSPAKTKTAIKSPR